MRHGSKRALRALLAMRPPLLRRPAAIDDERSARHERGGVTCQEHDCAGQILQLAKTAELDAAKRILAKCLVLKKWPRHWRFDEGWRQRVDANLVRGEFDCHRLGEAFHRVFGGAIDRTGRSADVAHLRGHIDNGATTLGLDQPARHSLCHEISRPHVERDHEIEILYLYIDKWRRPVGTRIVD